MEILEDILKEQKKQDRSLNELRKEISNSNKKPTVVNVDSDSINNEAYGKLRQPMTEVTHDLKTTLSEAKSVTAELKKLKQDSSIYGFASFKSALYFGGVTCLFMVLLGFTLVKYKDLEHRMIQANRHIRSVDSQVQRWIEDNPSDSKSFKKEVQDENFLRQF